MKINLFKDLELINTIVKATSGSMIEPGKPIRRIEDISPFEFKQDLQRTTDWHLYYTKLSALSLFVREKTYWPYFSQVFDEAYADALKIVRNGYPHVEFPDMWPFSCDIEAMLNVDFWE